ncbi:MAG: NUDIX domain-containing protein [Thermoplasmata archaeon]
MEPRLEWNGILVVDEAIARFLRTLKEGKPLSSALSSGPLSYERVRSWRERVRAALGSDPLERKGRHLVVSDAGKSYLEDYEKRSSALRVHLASGLKVPLLAVDGLVLHEGKLVAIKRRYYPFQGLFCLPGGIVEYGETVEEAVVREVEEETGLKTKVASLLGVYSNPDRDPRGHVVSLAFELEVVGGELVSGSDATEVGLLSLDDLPEMGFDHILIVEEFIKRRAG